MEYKGFLKHIELKTSVDWALLSKQYFTYKKKKHIPSLPLFGIVVERMEELWGNAHFIPLFPKHSSQKWEDTRSFNELEWNIHFIHILRKRLINGEDYTSKIVYNIVLDL